MTGAAIPELVQGISYCRTLAHRQPLLFVMWVTSVVFFLWRGLRAWRRYIDLWSAEKRDGSRPKQKWWPPKVSSLIILLGVILFIGDCLRHPPFGSSRLSILFNWCIIGLGFWYRSWE